jgi:ABC-type glutathione transport system ATPase component
MPSNGDLIQLQGVKKVFYTDEVETHALSDVHLTIKEGEYVSIAGPSGCGKTTLLSLLGLLDTPSEGTYLLEDRPVANLSAAERAQVSRRGQRLDESKPGSGLGLSIVVDLAALYGGSLSLGSAPIGGLRAELVLPGV